MSIHLQKSTLVQDVTEQLRQMILRGDVRPGSNLPSRKELTARGQGYLRPELSILLAYSKMNYFDAIVASDIPDDPFVVNLLLGYFPPVLAERYPKEIASHRLRREIVATQIAGARSARAINTENTFQLFTVKGTPQPDAAFAGAFVGAAFAT